MRFQYNVEAACSGLRSLTTMLALSCVFAFVFFRRTWKRAAMIATSVPLAVLGNATRLMAIVIAAENFGQSAGNFVHDHWFFSLLPYVPSVIGMALLAKVLREPEDAPAGGARE
jgi:exosortase/archaeosortase family protein